MMSKTLDTSINESKVVFWDFDGVIKDSVKVKSVAFEALFANYGASVSLKVRIHHEANGGVSRFEKIPLYLSWSSENVTDEKIQEFCNRFSLLVKRSVIDSPWVNGFLDFFERYRKTKKHILVTATPIEEIEAILQALNIRHFFYKVYGAPDDKSDAICKALEDLHIDSKYATMIGDSESDYNAAKNNDVLFFLRSTELNKNLQIKCKDRVFKDFTNE